MYLFLGVVNFSKEITVSIGQVSVLLQPQSKDAPVNKEEDTQKTSVINTEPFAGSLSSDGCCGRHEGGTDSGSGGHESSIVVWCSAQSSGGCLDKGCCRSKEEERWWDIVTGYDMGFNWAGESTIQTKKLQEKVSIERPRTRQGKDWRIMLKALLESPEPKSQKKDLIY